MIPDGVRYSGGVGYKNRPCDKCPKSDRIIGEKCEWYKDCLYWVHWFKHSWACFNRYAQKQAEMQEQMQDGTEV